MLYWKGVVIDEERKNESETRLLVRINGLYSFQCFDTNYWVMKGHLAYKNLILLVPEVHLWNAWRRRRIQE